MESEEITVSIEEAYEFVEKHVLIKDWPRKYPQTTWSKYAYEITRYFKWLGKVKGWNVTP